MTAWQARLPGPATTRGRRALVESLASAASRFSFDHRQEKLRLLEELSVSQIRSPTALLRLHETLCLLQAYPDDREMLAAVNRALEEFPARVHRLGAAARASLRDSGIAGTRLDYPFGFPMARWLASRFAGSVSVTWRRFEQGEQLEEVLSLLVTHPESEAFTEGGLGWRQWLGKAGAGRRLGDLQILVELFERAALPQESRDWLFESLALPIQWRLGGRQASRTGARVAGGPLFFHPKGVQRDGFDFVSEIRRPLPSLRPAPPPLAETVIDSARLAMATRLRELFAFSHPNPEDVLVAEPGRGLRIALVGLLPEFRLPLDTYYAFLILKNGVPVSYGAGWYMLGTLEFALNIFESFRQGESAFLFSQVLRVYRQATGMRAIVVDRYQIGHENIEALRSGAFYFYHRLGFRPADPDVLRVSEGEQKKIAREPTYRSPLSVLKQLASAEIYLPLRSGGSEPARRPRSAEVAALVTQHISREFGGDRVAAIREASALASRLLGAPRWRQWPRDERRAFERLALVAALIPDLARWPRADRHALGRIFRAKGAPSELPYLKLLDGHRRFRLSLAALLAGSRAAP